MINKGGEERGSGNIESRKRAVDNLLQCVSFCLDEKECRRVQLLRYFGETFPRENCKGTCDNCRNSKVVSIEDVTVHAAEILRLVEEFEHRRLPKLTLLKIAMVLYCICFECYYLLYVC
jgi:bloom syndrome protein